MNKKDKIELDTWLLHDKQGREEKLERERIRYPKLIKDMCLHLIRLDNKVVVDLGCGPDTLLNLLDIKEGIAIDPLINEYSKMVNQNKNIKYIKSIGEVESESVDLVICSNALDHIESPEKAIEEVERVLRPSGYVSILCCENNSDINKGPAHTLNLDYQYFRSFVDKLFETVHELTFQKDGYRYGWVTYRGKVGQPAWVWLGRKVRFD